MISPLEEALERLKNSFPDVHSHQIHSCDDFHIMCGSFAERYKSNRLGIGVQFLGIDGVPWYSMLVAAKRSYLSPTVGGRLEFCKSGSDIGSQCREKNSPVLIDIYEFIKDGEGNFLANVVFRPVRLQTIDQFESLVGDTAQSIRFDSTSLD